MIYDCRLLNEHLKAQPFKFETIDRCIELIEPNSFMMTVDLNSGYYHVGIDQNSQKLLGFRYRNGPVAEQSNSFILLLGVTKGY